MKGNRQENERFEQPYDFSRGVRGKYAARFTDPALFLRAAAERDVQRELGDVLLRLQNLEATLVAYYALIFHMKPVEAGSAALGLLNEPLDKASTPFWSTFQDDAREQPDARSRQIRRDLSNLFKERGWLIHRSLFDIQEAPPQKLAVVVERLEEIARRTENVTHLIRENLLTTCIRAGKSEDQVTTQIRQVIQEWAAA